MCVSLLRSFTNQRLGSVVETVTLNQLLVFVKDVLLKVFTFRVRLFIIVYTLLRLTSEIL